MADHAGSGTGELAGIGGEARIDTDRQGAHTLRLDYELGPVADASSGL